MPILKADNLRGEYLEYKNLYAVYIQITIVIYMLVRNIVELR